MYTKTLLSIRRIYTRFRIKGRPHSSTLSSPLFSIIFTALVDVRRLQKIKSLQIARSWASLVLNPSYLISYIRITTHTRSTFSTSSLAPCTIHHHLPTCCYPVIPILSSHMPKPSPPSLPHYIRYTFNTQTLSLFLTLLYIPPTHPSHHHFFCNRQSLHIFHLYGSCLITIHDIALNAVLWIFLLPSGKPFLS
jgi:hypothetical protein